MSDGPLDLRALADVDSPEVVREALRAFRRRALTRYVWVILAVVVFGVGVWWGRTPTTLQQRVDAAKVYTLAEDVWHVKGLTVALDRVADLGGTVGMHFVVIPDDRSVGRGYIEVTGESVSEGYGSWDQYIELRRPTTGVPLLTIVAGGQTRQIPLRPPFARIPADFWR